MQKPALNVGEAEAVRLDAVRALNVLDTPRESPFDRIVFVTAQAFRAPIAIISIIDADRQWFKAQVGLKLQELPRSQGLCNNVIRSGLPISIDDLRSDERYRESPLVIGAPFVRFYASVPLRGPGGACVGALCVLDTVVRTATASQLSLLGLLANEATDLLLARVVDDGTAPPWLGYSTVR